VIQCCTLFIYFLCFYTCLAAPNGCGGSVKGHARRLSGVAVVGSAVVGAVGESDYLNMCLVRLFLEHLNEYYI
jgi:hypothetical protein